jgi:predicted NBD/HSP70 family sugar kinase
MSMDVVLAMDTGGTSTRLLVQKRDGTELVRRVLPTCPGNYGQAMKEIVGTARFITGNHRLVAVGAGIAGALLDGVLTGSGNLRGWVGEDIQSDLSEALQVPATTLNDAEAAGLGEYAAFGRSLVYVIWGTGVGAAVIIDRNGHLVTQATELGHIIIDRNSRLQCGCGGFGHLEAHVSGGNIPNRRFGLRRGLKAEQLNDRQWNPVLRDMAVGLRSISAGALGLPIIMGGGIATKQSDRLPLLQTMIGELPSSCPIPTLYLAKHGEDSGLMGAAYAAWQLAA